MSTRSSVGSSLRRSRSRLWARSVWSGPVHCDDDRESRSRSLLSSLHHRKVRRDATGRCAQNEEGQEGQEDGQRAALLLGRRIHRPRNSTAAQRLDTESIRHRAARAQTRRLCVSNAATIKRVNGRPPGRWDDDDIDGLHLHFHLVPRATGEKTTSDLVLSTVNRDQCSWDASRRISPFRQLSRPRWTVDLRHAHPRPRAGRTQPADRKAISRPS